MARLPIGACWPAASTSTAIICCSASPRRARFTRSMQLLPPDVVIDHHEFSVAWRWVEKFGAMHAVDVMILEATHPGVPRSLTDIAAPPLSARARGGDGPARPVEPRLCHHRRRHGRPPGVAGRQCAGYRAQCLRLARQRLLPDRNARRRHRAAELPAPRRRPTISWPSPCSKRRRPKGQICAPPSRPPAARPPPIAARWSFRTSSRAGRSRCR